MDEMGIDSIEAAFSLRCTANRVLHRTARSQYILPIDVKHIWSIPTMGIPRIKVPRMRTSRTPTPSLRYNIKLYNYIRTLLFEVRGARQPRAQSMIPT